ncbi:MAG: hypothetical protein II920_00355, partial [Clostridia bacterium]|nr:hypothetical protein [Clostridia bacterium]
AFEALGKYSDSAEKVCEAAYLRAEELFNQGDYSAAFSMYQIAGSYADAPEKLDVVKKILFAVGDIITFGRYEQDAIASDGVEPIEWIVLDIDEGENRALLISRYGLDAYCYHHSTPYPTWEKSDVRAWLNGNFLNAAFTSAEQAAIVPVKISTPPYRGISGGNDTVDRIWLLSQGEAETYFKTNAERKAEATVYADAQGAFKGGDECCWWWLRSAGYNGKFASVVYSDGRLDSIYVTGTNASVRPAIWLRLDYMKISSPG